MYIPQIIALVWSVNVYTVAQCLVTYRSETERGPERTYSQHTRELISAGIKEFRALMNSLVG